MAGELRYGAFKRGSERLTTQLEAILSRLEILPLEEPADQRYGELRAHLEKRGQLIGPNDMLIAAHALALGYVVVTDNVCASSSRARTQGAELAERSKRERVIAVQSVG